MAQIEPLRIYIDTSVLGGCFDVEFAKWSNALIDDFRAGRLVPVLSDVTAAKAVEAPVRVRELHHEMLGLAGAVLAITPQVIDLVAAYEARKILGLVSEKCGDGLSDCKGGASAIRLSFARV